MQSIRLKSLTSLRALAAIGVFFSHMGVIHHSSNASLASTYKYLNFGYSGVTFFFILSGFILTYSFSRSLSSGGQDFKDFIIHRVFRIYPVHILCLFVFLGVNFYFNNDYNVDVFSLLKNALLLQSYSVSMSDYFSFNAVSWSISVEMFFYVIFCFFIFTPKRTILASALLILSLTFYLSINNALNGSITHWFYYINPLVRLPDFFIGILLCKIYLALNKQPSVVLSTMAEIGSIVLICVSIYIAANVGGLGGLEWDVMFIPSMSIAVFAFSYDRGLISKALSNKYLILLGDASFAFYLIHAIVIDVLKRYINVSGEGALKVSAFVMLALFLSMTLSVVIYIYYEKPLNKKLRLWWSEKQQKRTATRIEDTV